MQVGQAHLGGPWGPGFQRGLGQAGELVRSVLPHQFREHGSEVLFQGDLARKPPGLLLQGACHQGGHLLKRLILEQPGKEEVPGFEQRDVFIVLDLAGWQEPGCFEVQEGGGDDQELAGFIQGPLLAVLLELPDVFDELISDRGDGHFGNIQLVLGDQAEQEVERTREVGQTHLKAGFGLGHGVVRVRRRAKSALWPGGGRHRRRCGCLRRW